MMKQPLPTNSKRPATKWQEMSLGAKIVGIIGLAVIAFIGSAIITGIISAITHGSSANKPTNTSSHKTTQAKPAQAPTASLAALKAQVTPTLTTATTYLVNLYAKVQNVAAMSNAVAANSGFYHDKSTFDTKPDDTVYNAYKTVSDTYYNAHQDQPASLDNWNTDAEQLYTDINRWTQSKYNVLVDQLYNTPSDTHQSNLNAAAQAYSSDLAKVQADIKAL